jgi:hypothetical protein
MVRYPSMRESRTDAANNVRGSDRVTIAQAAALLGVHPNTIRNRVKAGVYDAEKVVTENGNTWMIVRNSLLNNPLPKGSQQTPSLRKPRVELQATELVQDLLRPFVEDLGRVREELGAERVRREQAEKERDELRRILESRSEATRQHETASEGPSNTHASPEGQGPPQERKRSWWREFFGLE